MDSPRTIMALGMLAALAMAPGIRAEGGVFGLTGSGGASALTGSGGASAWEQDLAELRARAAISQPATAQAELARFLGPQLEARDLGGGRYRLGTGLRGAARSRQWVLAVHYLWVPEGAHLRQLDARDSLLQAASAAGQHALAFAAREVGLSLTTARERTPELRVASQDATGTGTGATSGWVRRAGDLLATSDFGVEFPVESLGRGRLYVEATFQDGSAALVLPPGGPRTGWEFDLSQWVGEGAGSRVAGQDS